jgi:hypothetical protein
MVQNPTYTPNAMYFTPTAYTRLANAQGTRVLS